MSAHTGKMHMHAHKHRSVIVFRRPFNYAHRHICTNLQVGPITLIINYLLFVHYLYQLKVDTSSAISGALGVGKKTASSSSVKVKVATFMVIILVT